MAKLGSIKRQAGLIRKKSTIVDKVLAKIRGVIQGYTIRREAAIYRNLGGKLRISPEMLSEESQKAVLRKRLHSRGICWPIKKEAPHFVYASLPTNWERHNIPPQLNKIGFCSCYYLTERRGYNTIEGQVARREFTDSDLIQFLEELHAKKPVDIFVSYLSGAWLSASIISRINKMGIVTMMMHFDDRLSFKGELIGDQWSGAASVAAAYDLSLTSADDSIIKYVVEGGRAVFWPEGANPEYFKPLNLPLKYGVSFVGSKYGRRTELVKFLAERRIEVNCFGSGWERGAVPDDEIPRIYASSQINLGFGEIGYSSEQCLKGRDFEVPMCGALYLTQENRYLKKVYDTEKEIVTYNSHADCFQKINALLNDPMRCKSIRDSARLRALRDHTWVKRINDIMN